AGSDRGLLALRGPRRDRCATAHLVHRGRSGRRPMSACEYLSGALPAFKAATVTEGQSVSVVALNHEGADGWEAVGMTALGDGHVAVLMKRDAGIHASA